MCTHQLAPALVSVHRRQEKKCPHRCCAHRHRLPTTTHLLLSISLTEAFAGGTRIEAQLQLHPLVIGFLAILTVIASRIASIAAPEVLAMPGAGMAGGLGALLLLVMLFAAIANVEASKTLKLLSGVIGTPPTQRP